MIKLRNNGRNVPALEDPPRDVAVVGVGVVGRRVVRVGVVRDVVVRVGVVRDVVAPVVVVGSTLQVGLSQLKQEDVLAQEPAPLW